MEWQNKTGRDMRLFNLAGVGLLTISVWCTCAPLAIGQQAEPKADNTKRNQRDRDKAEPTADQQKENKSDRDLTKNIRQAIVKDKSLSTDAHNVKIIAQNGMVTLKGPVKSDAEKQAVEAKATEVAGAGKVKSEIEVKSNSADRSKQ
jgi:hyperosmotically inducible periplasmic protein